MPSLATAGAKTSEHSPASPAAAACALRCEPPDRIKTKTVRLCPEDNGAPQPAARDPGCGLASRRAPLRLPRAVTAGP